MHITAVLETDGLYLMCSDVLHILCRMVLHGVELQVAHASNAC